MIEDNPTDMLFSVPESDTMFVLTIVCAVRIA